MSDTAEGWGMVADLLAANADRFPDVDLTEVIMLCRSEVDRLDREAEMDELARLILLADAASDGGYTAARRVRAIAEWLIAEAAWKSALDGVFQIAEKPAPRSWPSLDQVPHDVREVTDSGGDRYERTGDGLVGWSYVNAQGDLRICIGLGLAYGPFMEVSA